jgi:geranylgeranyl pyrophosphate synthase
MPNNTFTEFAELKRPLVNKQLQAVLAEQRSISRRHNMPYHELLKQLSILINRGGKRLRPLLFLLAYESYGGRRQTPSLRIAASQGLLHSFFLIHDDIIDRDYHRWGGQNILGVYFDRYSKTMAPRDALHAAEAQALLAGDACAALADQLLLTSGFGALQLLKAQQMQQQTILTVIGGEVAECAYPYAGKLPSEAQVLQLYRDKTASYSLGLPLRLGALLAGEGDKELEMLSAFADHHGVAFQLQDDLLGMFGDERKTGKPAISDLREGRRTVLVIKTLEMASPAARKKLLTLLGNDSVDEQSLAEARTIMIETGARDYVDGLARSLTEQSLTYLTQSTMSKTGKQRLIDLMALLVNRDH